MRKKNTRNQEEHIGGRPRSFSLGGMYVTANAQEAFTRRVIDTALARHAACDWGDIPECDRRLNELSLAEDGRLFSVYRFDDGSRLWVITEWGRSYTTVMLPENY